MVQTLVVVSCGRRKIWDKYPEAGPTPARDAYRGTFFSLNRDYAERFSDRWAILSAKYGFVDPEFIIQANYNVTFSKPETGPISNDQLGQQVDDRRFGVFPEVVVLGGRDYGERVTHAFEDTSSEVILPFLGLAGIGYMMQAVRQALDRNRPLERVNRGTPYSPVTKRKQHHAPGRPRRKLADIGPSPAPQAPDFEEALSQIFTEAERSGVPHVDVAARDLHRRVGGYPGPSHRMPVCCGVMYRLMKSGDEILAAPPSGRGASLRIRYGLPR